MAVETYIEVGKLGKPHGIHGAFRFLLSAELKNKRKFPKHFTIESKGTALPWFIKELEWTAPLEGIIFFEEVTSPEQAKSLAGRELTVSEKEFKLYFKEESEDIDLLIGYTALTEAKVEIGLIKEIAQSPGQELLVIEGPKGEVLIPWVEEFVVKVNNRKKEIILNLPEGLIDL